MRRGGLFGEELFHLTDWNYRYRLKCRCGLKGLLWDLSGHYWLG